jgi:hypothetical protein
MLALGAPLGEIPADAAPEAVLSSKWHQPLAEPVRERVARGSPSLIAAGA